MVVILLVVEVELMVVEVTMGVIKGVTVLTEWW